MLSIAHNPRKIARLNSSTNTKLNVITLSINGASRPFSAPLNVAELIEQLGYTGKRVALERNGEIVPRSTYANVRLCDGDKLEVVVAVGGG